MIIAFLLAGTSIFAQLNESFEDTTSFGTWTKVSPDGGTGWDHVTMGTTPIPGFLGGTMTIPAGGGTYAAYCNYETGGATSNNQWLITPQIAVQSNQKLTFELFWFGAYYDKMDIKVSTTTNATTSFTTTLLATDTTDYIQNGWKHFEIPLTAYAGQNIYIAFNENISDNQTDGAFIAIDLVKVLTGSNIVENNANLALIFPNPVKNELNITTTSNMKSLKITNSLGQVVINNLVKGNSYKVNTTSLNAGVYFVQMETSNGISTQKFVVSE